MMRMLCVIGVLLASVLSTSASVIYFMPLREIARQSFVTVEGAATPRYQFRYVRDSAAPAACVLILTDEQTGHFALTSVPSDACAVREGR